ncbi:MAG: hypothetical protein WC406_13455 [Methanoregula sp.]|jgi:hypothetical protein
MIPFLDQTGVLDFGAFRASHFARLFLLDLGGQFRGLGTAVTERTLSLMTTGEKLPMGNPTHEILLWFENDE